MSDAGPQTIVELNMNGQRVHIYRRGKGGPVAICVDSPGHHLPSMDVSPEWLLVAGTTMTEAAHKIMRGQA